MKMEYFMKLSKRQEALIRAEGIELLPIEYERTNRTK